MCQGNLSLDWLQVCTNRQLSSPSHFWNIIHFIWFLDYCPSFSCFFSLLLAFYIIINIIFHCFFKEKIWTFLLLATPWFARPALSQCSCIGLHTFACTTQHSAGWHIWLLGTPLLLAHSHFSYHLNSVCRQSRCLSNLHHYDQNYVHQQ